MSVNIEVIKCKYCGGSNMERYGHQGSEQLWWCDDCKRKQTGKDTLFKMRYPSDQIATALRLYYAGLSLDKVQDEFKQQYHTHVAISTLYEWLQEFTNETMVRAIVLLVDVKLALTQSKQNTIITIWKRLHERIHEFELSEFEIGFPSGIKIKFVRKHK